MTVFFVSLFLCFLSSLLGLVMSTHLLYQGRVIDILLMVVVVLARHFPHPLVILSVLIGGVITDTFLFVPLGFFSFFYILSYFLLDVTRDSVLIISPSSTLLLFYFALAIKFIYALTLSALLGLRDIVSYSFSLSYLWDTGLTILLFSFCMGIVVFIRKYRYGE